MNFSVIAKVFHKIKYRFVNKKEEGMSKVVI